IRALEARESSVITKAGCRKGVAAWLVGLKMRKRRSGSRLWPEALSNFMITEGCGCWNPRGVQRVVATWLVAATLSPKAGHPHRGRRVAQRASLQPADSGVDDQASHEPDPEGDVAALQPERRRGAHVKGGVHERRRGQEAGGKRNKRVPAWLEHRPDDVAGVHHAALAPPVDHLDRRERRHPVDDEQQHVPNLAARSPVLSQSVRKNASTVTMTATTGLRTRKPAACSASEPE